MNEPQITSKEFARAAERLSILRYYPTGEKARDEIALVLKRLCSTPAQLEWLVRQMIDGVGEWRGPVDLRRVYAQRFKPADGVEPEELDALNDPGRAEMRYIEQAGAEFEEQMREWKRTRLLTGDAEEQKPAHIEKPAAPLRYDNPGGAVAPTVTELEARLAADMERGDKRSPEERARLIEDLHARLCDRYTASSSLNSTVNDSTKDE